MPPSLPSDILHLIFACNIPTPTESPPCADTLPHVWTPCEPNWRPSTRHLTSVVLVSRSWWEAGMPLLYRHVQLASYDDLSGFVASVTSSKTAQHGGHGHWVRKITYQFQCPYKDGESTYPDAHLVSALATMLGACPDVQAIHHGLNFDPKIVRQLCDPAYHIELDEDVKIQPYDIGAIMRGLQPNALTSLVFENKEKFTVWDVFGAIGGLRSLQSLALNVVAIKDSGKESRDKSLQVSFPDLKLFTCGFYLGEGMEQSMAFLADKLEMPSLKDLKMAVVHYGTGWPICDEPTAAHLGRFLKRNGKLVEDLRLVLDFYEEDDSYGGPDTRMRLENLLKMFPQLKHLAINPCEFVLCKAGTGSSPVPIPLHAQLLKSVTYVAPKQKPYDPETSYMRSLGAPRLDDARSLYRHLLAYADTHAFPALEKLCITEKRIILHYDEDTDDDYKRVEMWEAAQALLRRGLRVEVGVGVPVDVLMFVGPPDDLSDDSSSDEAWNEERYWDDDDFFYGSDYDDYL